MRNTNIQPDVHLFPVGGEDAFPFRLISTGLVQAVGLSLIQRTNYDRCTIELVLGGEGYLEINGTSWHLRKGDVYFLHKKSNHRYYADRRDPWKKLFFIVNGRLADEILAAHGLSSVFVVPAPPVHTLFRRMHELDRVGDPRVHRRAALIFHELAAALHDARVAPRAPGCPANVLRVKEYLDSHLEGAVSLADLRGLVGKSEAHIIRTFKRAVGRTPYDYLLSRRQEFAELLLSDTALPVREIARRLHFADEYYFSNFFKKRTGLSPRHYRKKLALPAG